MNKVLLSLLLFSAFCLQSSFAKTYFVATDGSDANSGTIEHPFASLRKAQSLVAAGDTVFIRGGVYHLSNNDIMGVQENLYNCVFLMDKSGKDGRRICYFGYPGERPVFDLGNVLPADGRISVFYVKGSYLHFRNFEIINTKVVPVAPGVNTQSECFRNRGSYNIYENLAMHDGEAIGWYLIRGGNNLVLNCDAYNNYDATNKDDLGKSTGGNVDGFGCHPGAGDTGNIIRGCRAWLNSDDGYDCINSAEAVTFDHCWAFHNGYTRKNGKLTGAADGNGIKAGGYGMSDSPKAPEVIPMHRVTNCIAYYNKSGGIYSNHHLGGVFFANNSSYNNRYNYNMVCRKSVAEAVDVDGYGHKLSGNVSFQARETEVKSLDYAQSLVKNCSFYPVQTTITEQDFLSLDPDLLLLPRKADGSLPDIDFLRPAESSAIYKAGMGHLFPAPEDILADAVPNADWLMVPTIIVTDDGYAEIQGDPDAVFNKFYINGTSVKISKQRVSLADYSGRLELKATSSTTGGIIKLLVER